MTNHPTPRSSDASKRGNWFNHHLSHPLPDHNTKMEKTIESSDKRHLSDYTRLEEEFEVLEEETRKRIGYKSYKRGGSQRCRKRKL